MMFLKLKPIGFAVVVCSVLALAPVAIVQGGEAEEMEKFAGREAHGEHPEFGGFRRGRGPCHRGGGQGMRPFSRGDGPGLMRWLHSPRIRRELDLTEEQGQKLKDIGLDAAKTAIRQRADIKIQRLELAQLMGAENPDRAAIVNKLEQIGQIETALKRSMVNAFLDGRSVLTEEQRAKVKELMGKRAGRRDSGHRPSLPPPPE